MNVADSEIRTLRGFAFSKFNYLPILKTEIFKYIKTKKDAEFVLNSKDSDRIIAADLCIKYYEKKK